MKISKICCLFAVLLAFSCKKEYTCQCTSSKGTYDSGTIDRKFKSTAKKDCESLSSGETTCKVKG